MKRRTLSLLIFAIYGNVLYAHLSGLYFGEEFYSMLKLHVTTWYHGLLLYDTDPSFNPISISMSENNFGELSEAEKERETIRFISWFLQNKPTIVYKKNDFRKIAKILNEYFEEIIQKNKNYCIEFELSRYKKNLKYLFAKTIYKYFLGCKNFLLTVIKFLAQKPSKENFLLVTR